MNGRDRPSTAEDLFARYLALRESGKDLPFERFVQDHVEFESELVHLARGWDRFEDVFDGALQKASSTLFFRRGRSEERPSAGARMAAVGLKAGAAIGEFRLLRMLAEGGMGQVWEAHQPALDRRVALKFIRPDNVDPDALFLFEREARAGGRLHHPCAVAVYATGESAGVRWIAQELVEGGYTLDDFLADLRRDGKLPRRYYAEVARFFLDVAEVLQAAHDAGVIHRDVKPGNVLISPDDRPKLTDFGLARLMDDDRRSDPLALRGTPHYMSPEQVSAKAVDARSEVFSLGSMLYEVLTLRRPFEGKTRSEIFGAILRGDPRPPQEVDARVPHDLSVICSKALSREPEDRYATMRELADDLRRFLAHEPILARPAGPVQHAVKWVRRHCVQSVIAVLVVALLTAGLALALTWSAGRGMSRAFLRDAEILKAELAIEAGDFAGAREHARLAMEADPGDPRPHLVLAQGYARFARLDEAERSIKRAVDLGFQSTSEELQTAVDHHQYALYVIATRKVAGYAEAERHLARAVELDPGLKGAYYPLYQVRSALGDSANALLAVRALCAQIGTGEDIYPVMEALALELEGSASAAAEILEGVVAKHEEDPELLESLRVRRALGRCYLRTGNLDRAEELFLQATEDLPEDDSSWLNLAEIELRRFASDPDAEQSEKLERLDRALEHVRRGRGWDPDRPASRQTEARAAVFRFGLTFDRGAPPSTEAWDEVEEAVRALRATTPDDPYLPWLTGHLDFLRALVASTPAAVKELHLRCLDAYPRHVPARVLLAQELWYEGDYHRSLEQLEEALDAWRQLEGPKDPGDISGHYERRWLFALHVWTYGAASLAVDLDAARAAREAVEREIREGYALAPEELISYAEFLATPADDQLKDCARAKELLAEHDLEERLGPKAEPVLEAIDEACR